LIIVINHPAFRIPQRSAWVWDDKTSSQFRRLDAYMSEAQIKIDMTPGEKLPQKKKSTISNMLGRSALDPNARIEIFPFSLNLWGMILPVVT